MWFIFVRKCITHVIDAGGFDDDVYNLAYNTLLPRAESDDACLNSAVIEFATHPRISISAALQGAIGLCNGEDTDPDMNWSRMILSARLCLTRNGRPTDKVARAVFRALRDCYSKRHIEHPIDPGRLKFIDTASVLAARTIADTHCCGAPLLLATLCAHDGGRLDVPDAVHVLCSTVGCNMIALDVAYALTSVAGGVSFTDREVVNLIRKVWELHDMANDIDDAPNEFDDMLRSYDQ
ncbi:hypothetical protein CYMTET_48473 [Cymbomonas tetramitiformis]|uniref:Uncharacterized protein n=1 Tax=Cymbomonas tetramitiformis TaxID=36881 RepID=A0AAE0BTU2_9CHLO|nr:hypothetical protein CYMTET_48473 [Cymbomonas tetramitiformis]